MGAGRGTGTATWLIPLDALGVCGGTVLGGRDSNSSPELLPELLWGLLACGLRLCTRSQQAIMPPLWPWQAHA